MKTDKTYKMKTKEEILQPYIERLFTHSTVVDADNALKCMDQYADIQVKQALLKFKVWYDKASPSELVSLWSDDGSEKGVFTMSDNIIIDRFIKKHFNMKTKEEILDTILGGGKMLPYTRRRMLDAMQEHTDQAIAEFKRKLKEDAAKISYKRNSGVKSITIYDLFQLIDTTTI